MNNLTIKIKASYTTEDDPSVDRASLEIVYNKADYEQLVDIERRLIDMIEGLYQLGQKKLVEKQSQGG